MFISTSSVLACSANFDIFLMDADLSLSQESKKTHDFNDSKVQQVIEEVQLINAPVVSVSEADFQKDS